MLRIDDILLARDFSPVSNQALRRAVDLAARTGATLHVLYAEVLHKDPFAPGEVPSPAADVDAIRRKLAEDGRGGALADQVDVREAVVRDVAAAPAILSYAEENDVDLITLGTHGRRGVRRMLIGSVAEEVVRRANRPVLTVRGRSDDQTVDPEVQAVNRILVPVDFSKHARSALRSAAAVAPLYDASLHALHVVEDKLHPAFYVGGVQSIYDADPDIEAKAEKKLHEFVRESTDAEVTVHVTGGKPAREITSFTTDEDIDLVVMSTHGQSGLEHFFLGSVAEKVVRHVPCPVLTTKAFGHSLLADDPVAAAEASD